MGQGHARLAALPRLLLIALIVAPVVSCAQTDDLRTPPPPPPPEVFFVKGTSPLHVNSYGDGVAELPVVVRIYHLSDTKNFEENAEDFQALWRTPGETLGDQLVDNAPQEIRVDGEDPDADPRVVRFDPPVTEDVTHIAFLANFYSSLPQEGDAVQRTLVLTPAEVRQSIIRLQGYVISAVPRD